MIIEINVFRDLSPGAKRIRRERATILTRRRQPDEDRSIEAMPLWASSLHKGMIHGPTTETNGTAVHPRLDGWSASSLSATPLLPLLAAPHRSTREASKMVAVIPSQYYAIKCLWFTAAHAYVCILWAQGITLAARRMKTTMHNDDLPDHVLVALRRIIRATDLHWQAGQKTGLTTPQLVIIQASQFKRPDRPDIAKAVSLSHNRYHHQSIERKGVINRHVLP